jgi:hypothetical protein
MMFTFKNEKFFREYDFSENYDEEDYLIEKLEQACNLFFSNSSKKAGFNKEKEKCLRGYRATYYTDLGLMYEPIIFNIDKKQAIIDWKVMGFNHKEADEYTKKLNRVAYQRKESICFIFYNNYDYHEFLFNKQNKPNMFIESLNKIFDKLTT